jgi:hypothetical protein
MPNLERSDSIPKCGQGKIHNWKRCSYVTKAPFYMVNRAKRHRLPLESSRCERNDLEKYYCKDCNFETDLVVILKQHLKEYHRKDTDCVQDRPKNNIVVKSYICQNCSFETYSVLLWIKHLESSCFDTEDVIHCCLKQHKRHHLSAFAFQWYSCDICQFKVQGKGNLRRHKKNHLSADAVKWYRCDKCEFKTKGKGYLKQHKNKKIHRSADAVQWYSCDKCEYKTKQNRYLKQHKKIITQQMLSSGIAVINADLRRNGTTP